MNIALLHYSYAPVIGGVELILEQHACLFADHGHRVTVICGAGQSEDSRVELLCIPELVASHPLTREAQRELDGGVPGAKCSELTARFVEKLGEGLKNVDILFIHNILTMPFNLCCTSALWELAGRSQAAETAASTTSRATRFVGWIHDVAAANPDYHFPHLDRLPWKLLVVAHPGFEYVAVSEHRRRAFEAVTGESRCEVIPNGVNPCELLELTAPVAELVKKENLFGQELVLLHPVRILKRKNIELGIRTAGALAARGCSCRYLVTGAPDPHNPASLAYAEFLQGVRAELGAEGVIFVNELFHVTRRDLASLYRIADVLFFPSRQEGFGIPLLEAAVCGLPILCADVEPMKSLWRRAGSGGKPGVMFFDPDIDPRALAEVLIDFCRESPTIRNRKFAIREHSWENIYANYLQPLLARRKNASV